MASRYNAKEAVYRALDHAGAVAAEWTVPTWANPPCAVSPGGSLALLRGASGLTLVRASDGRAVVVPLERGAQKVEWLGETRVVVVRYGRDGDPGDRCGLEVHDVAAALAGEPYAGEPGRKRRKA